MIDGNAPVIVPANGIAAAHVPALVAAAGERASMRSLECCAATIRNPHI